MSKIIKEIVVDVAKKSSLKTIFAKQNDSNSRFLKVTLHNEGETIKVPETAQAILNVCRADGSAKAFFGTVNPNGTVTMPLTSWALGIDDTATCSISIIGEDGEKLTSTSFSVSVEAAEYTGEDISEDEDKDVLTSLISDCNEAKSACDAAAQLANTKAQEAAAQASYAYSTANAAANNANNAATTAHSAVEKATAAVASANEATQSAITAAESAQSATTAAISAAETAGNAATAANNAVQEANTVLDIMKIAVNHRNIYRGKDLGTSVTEVQKSAIQNGTFDDLYIGDYWSIGGVNWVIADMDYFYQTGDTALTKHHLVIVPQSNLYSAKMNATNTTTGGYVGSEMYTTNLDQAKVKIQAAFGNMVLSHRDILINAVTNGRPSGYAWMNSEVELMTEVMVYGTYHYAAMNTGSPLVTKYTTARQQFALFKLNPYEAFRRAAYWLRDIVSSSYFARVLANGGADSYNASISSGVRPYFCIG